MAPKTSIAQRIAQLDAKKKALQARLAKQERAMDTRRKVLLGALILHRIENDLENGERMKAWVAKELPGFLTRDGDKELFPEFISAGAAQPPSSKSG